MKPRLYLDEDITPLLARLMRERGHDVISCRDIGATGIPDDDQLERATELGRAILSSNYGDFIRLSRECVRDGRPHGGIIVSYHQIDIASRICSLCAAGEILVSATVRDLARTSAGVTFEDRGEHILKGIDDPVRVFAVTRGP